MAQEKENILGVGLHSTTSARVLNFIRLNLQKTGKARLEVDKFLIVTPNPEIVNIAQNDTRYKSILNKADLSLPDGVGLLAANKYLKLGNPENKAVRFITLLFQGVVVGVAVVFRRSWLKKDMELIHGRKMFSEIIALANKKSWRVYLYGGRQGSAEGAAEKLRFNFKKVRIEAMDAPEFDMSGKPKTKGDRDLEKVVVEKINRFKPHILFVGIQPPKQEKWLARNWDKLDMGGAMVVGGTFDHISGWVKSPPGFIEKLEMEWVWRMFTQIGRPRNVRRILDSVIVFPWRVFKYKFGK